MLDINLLDQNLVEINIEASTNEEVLDIMSKKFISNGYAKESFLDAIKEREKVFATGLPTETIGVAIPHTDIEHVVRPAVGIGVLKNPVKFTVMGTPDETVDVKIVFMLAFVEAHMQLQLLADLTDLFQDPKILIDMSEAKSAEEALSIVKAYLANK